MWTVIILMSLLGIMTVDAAKTSPSRDCICTQEYEPVCARIGQRYVTYSNECRFNCENDRNAEIVFKGPCGEENAFQQCNNKCPKTFQQVCGSDGNEYASDCSVKCYRIFKGRKGLYVVNQGRCE